MLGTKVKEITSREELENLVKENENALICAGRLGPMCIPVYKAMEQMENEEQFSHVKFYTVDFDTNAAMPIRNDSMCAGFMGLPFTAYFKQGKIVHATSSIQSRAQLEENIKKVF